MADTFKFMQIRPYEYAKTLDINDGTTYKILGAEMPVPDPDVLWHVPDYGEALPVRMTDPDREMMINMLVSGSSDDAIMKSIATLRHWLNEAKRASLGESYHPVYLMTQVNGQTPYTRHRIKYGTVDDSASHFRSERQLKDIAIGVVIRLVLAPHGEFSTSSHQATTAYSLRNELPSSPHFVEDSNSDGLADGWNLVGAPTGYAISTDSYIVGGSSQFVGSADTDEGIMSDVVTSQSTGVCGYAWVRTSGIAGVKVQIYNETAASVVQTKTLAIDDSGGVSADSIQPETGGWFYKVVLSGTVTASDNVRIRVISAAGPANEFYVDACYLDTTTTTAPTHGWMSARAIDNRNDIQSTSAATENYLHYVDVWDLAGDAPARLRWKGSATLGSSQSYFIAGRMSDGFYLAAEQPSWIISDDFNTNENQTNGSWADTTSTGASEADHIRRFTATGAGASGTTYATITGDNARRFLATPRRVFVRAMASNGGEGATLTLSTAAPICHMAKTATFTTHSTWELLDIGTINGVGVLPQDNPKTASPSFLFKITVAGVPNTETIDVDAVILFPATEFMIAKAYTAVATTEDVWFDGIQETFIADNITQREPAVAGSLWECPSGRLTSSRFVFAMTTSANVHTLTDALAFTVQMQPRTRHLLDR